MNTDNLSINTNKDINTDYKDINCKDADYIDKEQLHAELMKLVDVQDKEQRYTLPDFFKQTDQLIKRYKQNTNSQKTILITQFNGIGDAILLSGFVRELRQIFSKAYIIFACNDVVCEMYKDCPYIDEILSINLESIRIIDVIREIITAAKIYLWDKNIDLAISPHSGENNKNALFLNYFSLAKERLGYGENNYVHLYNIDDLRAHDILSDESLEYDSTLLSYRMAYPVECLHEVSRKFFILIFLLHKENIQYNLCNTSLETWFQQDDVDYVNNYVKDIKERKIALGIGGRFGAKLYSIKKYIYALRRINEYELKVNKQLPKIFIFAGVSEKKQIEILMKEIPNCANINKLSIRQSMLLMRHCDIFIGNDTGSVHMAAAANVPIIELHCQAKSKDDVYPHYASSFDRFRPWTNNCIILRPKEPINQCREDRFLIHSHCLFGIDREKNEIIEPKELTGETGHCINVIKPKDIFNVYKIIVENNFDANIETNLVLQKLNFDNIVIN